MRVLLRNAGKRFLFRSRLHKLSHSKDNFHILAYHMIAEHPNGFYPETSYEAFARQIEYLKRNYNVLSLEEIVRRASQMKSVRRCVAVTFDDGFRDNYEKAYPVLKQLQLPATIFLTTGCIEKAEIPWFIRFRSLFLNTRKDRLEIELGGGVEAFSMPGRNERLAVSDRVMGYLQTCSNERRISILELLPSLLGIAPAREMTSPMLTWDQIREMSGNGISFGAHTVTHPVLSRINPNSLLCEIQSSRDTIENKARCPVKTFAYPFGRKEHYPRETPSLLRCLGFLCAVTTEPGVNSSASDPYELKRSGPWELSLL